MKKKLRSAFGYCIFLPTYGIIWVMWAALDYLKTQLEYFDRWLHRNG